MRFSATSITVNILFFYIILITSETSAAKLCPGYCTNDIRGCKFHDGKIIAYCKNGQACCNAVDTQAVTCGETRNGSKPTFFKSPNFPNTTSGDLTCEFKLVLQPTSTAVKIDFLDVVMDGMKFGGKDVGECDSDIFFIKGFTNWTPPPRCGNLSGYSTIIDRWDSGAAKMKTLSILAVMSSTSYKWLIRISQFSQNDRKFNEPTNSSPKSENDEAYTSDSYGTIDIPAFVNPKLLSETEALNLQKSNSREVLDFDTSSETIKIENGRNTHETKNHSKWHSSFIVNGKNTKITLVPWQASIRNRDKINTTNSENCTFGEGSHFCGGSIIDNRHILSAAHCFFGSSKLNTMPEISSIKIVLGDTNRCVDEPGHPRSIDFSVESIVFHYGYDDTSGSDDIVVIRLKENIKFRESVKPIKLADQAVNITGQEVLLSGWGMTKSRDDHGNLPKILQSTPNIIVENKNTCLTHFEELFETSLAMLMTHPKYIHVFNSLVCTGTRTGTKPANAGAGDSGGPLVIFKDNEPIQVGICSYGVTGEPGGHQKKHESVDFYQSVPFYRNWIHLATTIGSG